MIAHYELLQIHFQEGRKMLDTDEDSLNPVVDDEVDYTGNE
jgi:hypothetical protein